MYLIIRTITVILASLVLLAALAVDAENPEHGRHPNLAAAHRLCSEAYERITKTQEANEWDMDGHAKKAKEMLEQVNAELKIAVEAATKNK